MDEKTKSKQEKHRKQQQKYYQQPEIREKSKKSCQKYYQKNKAKIKEQRRKRRENLQIKLSIAREWDLFNDETNVIIKDDKLWSSSIIKEKQLNQQQISKQNILQITNSWELEMVNDGLLDINLNLFDDIILNENSDIPQEHNYSIQNV